AYTSLLPFVLLLFLLALRPPPHSTLFPYTTLFRSHPCWERDRHQLVTQADTLNPLHTDLRRQNLVLVGYVDRHIHIGRSAVHRRSEEHTSELQSRFDLVCRLLLEKKKNNSIQSNSR